MPLSSNITRADAPVQGTIYDDLPFHGEQVAVEAPPPVEIRELPYQFSLLQLLGLMTAAALFFTLAHVLGGIGRALIVVGYVGVIALVSYLKSLRRPSRWRDWP